MSGRLPPTDRSRRRVLFGALGISSALLTGHRAMAAPSEVEHADLRRHLKAVRRWGCQYQNIDVAEIAASDLDLIAVEPSLDDDANRFISAAQVEALKRKPDGGRRIVLGYLCVGEADTKRWFWPAAWRNRPPDWLGPENSEWPGSYPVRYWQREWRDLLLDSPQSLLQQLLDAGYDGALLDRVDAFQDWQSIVPNAPELMIDLVVSLAERARSQRPGFLLLPQNAEPLLRYPAYRGVIDGLNKESLLAGLQGQNQLNTAEDVAWSLGYIDQVRRLGLKLLATEYTSDPGVTRQVTRRLLELGFTPFIGRRALDRMPEPPPVD